MHEQSLVRSLLKQVESIYQQSDGDGIAEVRVEMGPLSGVEPLLLDEAFRLLAPHSCAAGATLAIDEVPLIAECGVCEIQFKVESFRFHCPDCDGNVRVVQGDALRLTSISVDSRTPHEEPAP